MRNIKKILIAASTFFSVALVIFVGFRAAFITPSIWVDPLSKHVFNSPTHMVPIHLPTTNGVQDFLVTEKAGRVYHWKAPFDKEPRLILDIVERTDSADLEDGMLSSALLVEEKKSSLFVYRNLGSPGRVRLSRFNVTIKDDLNVDKNSEVILFELDKVYTGHNGGHIQFGPDGMLWFSVGDGHYSSHGRTDQLLGNKTLFGAVSRIDVRNSPRYTIPEDNPFVGNKVGTPEEVWSYGFRNPWRFSFVDSSLLTNPPDYPHLMVGDVGEASYEEVNFVRKGVTYGWPTYEGQMCNIDKCDRETANFPLAAFSQKVLRSITGGIVYQGSLLTSLKGKYVFGDYLRGLMSLEVNLNDPQNHIYESYTESGFDLIFPKMPMNFGTQKGRTLLFVHIQEGLDKEIYLVSLNGGIFKMVPITPFQRLRAFFYEVFNFR
jgi:hypothetical protein